MFSQSVSQSIFDKLRPPAVAGAFYPGDSQTLKNQIKLFFKKTEIPKIKGQIQALIVPHAGYDFSGQVASYAYKILKGKSFDTVILIGNSHHQYFEGASVYPQGFYQTPLGRVEIDAELAQALIKKSSQISFFSEAHQKEHSLEVQLPFLQVVLDKFKIVPILFGNTSKDFEFLSRALIEALKQADKKVLFIASSDLAHYPSYEDEIQADKEVIKAVLTGEAQKLEKTLRSLEAQNIPQASTFMCGEEAVKAVMAVAKALGAHQIQLLKHANSGDAEIGDKLQVVGYSSIAFFKQIPDYRKLTKKEQAKLLEIAKKAVENFIKHNSLPEFSVGNFPRLKLPQGAFVTLKKQGELRGCIGHFGQNLPLFEVVAQMAIAAATKDGRFLPVTPDELPELEYEISVLSPLKRIKKVKEIVLGTHGVKLVQGERQGIFLPQVASETGWPLEEFLGQICSQKMGLSPDCWKDPLTEIYTFTAQVFSEKDL